MGKLDRFVQSGRICYIADGPDKGKLACIAEIIDQNRALVDGPCTGVARQPINLRQLHLTGIVVPLPHGARSHVVKKLWEKEDVAGKWSKTKWAQKLERKKLRSAMTDYDRYVVMKAKQRRRSVINTMYGKIKKTFKPKTRKPNKKVHKRE